MRYLATLLLLLFPATWASAGAPSVERDESWSRWGKSQIRRMVTGSVNGTDERFGVEVDADWSTAPSVARRVVLVHGFNSAPSSMAPLADAMRRRGHPCAMACYPNDQAIDRSAHRIANELRPLVRATGGAPVAVVTHSMGGLVARQVLENPHLDPGKVDRLIMVAPPNHGSNLARVSMGTDIYEHAWLSKDEHRKTGFYHSVDDGMGEATHDLRPGSKFLKQLNAQPRNPRVAYTIILGSRGKLSDKKLEKLRDSYESIAKKRRTLSWFSSGCKNYLPGCDEVRAGRGDGAVAIRRGRLAGVDDLHVLPGTHDMIHLRGKVGVQLEAIIAKRL